MKAEPLWVDHLLSRKPTQRDGNNLLFSALASTDWQRRQAESVERYTSEHYNRDPRPAQMFGNFIATGLLDRNAVVLDVGCGLTPSLPHYVNQLGLTRYLGIEPLSTKVERSYPCLVGALAEDIPLKDASMDAVLFATSFDHIADDRKAMEEVKRVLKPGGLMFMWQGVSDPELLALNSTLHRLTRGPWAIPLITAQAAKMSWRMYKRRRDLAKGNRLDSAHERWFTRKQLLQAVGAWGFELNRYLEPIGLPCMYIEAVN